MLAWTSRVAGCGGGVVTPPSDTTPDTVDAAEIITDIVTDIRMDVPVDRPGDSVDSFVVAMDAADSGLDSAEIATDAAPESASSDEGPSIPYRHGSVTISQYTWDGGGTTTFDSVAAATFYTILRDLNLVYCTTQTRAECGVSICTFPTSDGGLALDAGVTTIESAGNITISGLATSPIMLVPGSDNRYPLWRTSTPIFAGGESVLIAAAGAPGSVPMFTQTLTAPTPIAITSPIFGSPPVTINRATDFNLVWTDGGAGEVVVVLTTLPTSSSTTSTTGYVAICQFPASAGMATIPSSTLMLLAPGTGQFQIGAASVATVTAGEFTVTIDIGETAVSGSATFE